jgi:ABC-type transport system substrate-binding protein
LKPTPKAGAIADVRVRRAVNYAVDKVAYRDGITGRYGPTGELASTILAPGSLGYRPYDLYPTPGGRGDPAKAKSLLAQAGYPHGLTLTFVTQGSGRLAAGRKPIEASLKRAGIRLKTTYYHEGEIVEESLAIPAKRRQHQLGQSGWIQDDARPHRRVARPPPQGSERVRRCRRRGSNPHALAGPTLLRRGCLPIPALRRWWAGYGTRSARARVDFG